MLLVALVMNVKMDTITLYRVMVVKAATAIPSEVSTHHAKEQPDSVTVNQELLGKKTMIKEDNFRMDNIN